MLKSIRNAIGVGLAWFFIGAFIGLIVFEGLVDPDGKIADIWPAVLGYPGFLGGVTFFALTRILERGRKLHELSYSRAAICGALSGPVWMALFVLGVATGALADFKGDRVPWVGIAQVTGIMVPAFAFLGWCSAWMARQIAAPPGTRAQVGRTS
jgi:hypothetical protein